MRPEAKQQHYEVAERLLSEQNFAAALVAGAVAALVAAALYGVIVAKWNFSYGFAAAGIGIVVGIPMQFLGRGIETRFAVAAVVYTIAGCIFGNLFRVVSSSPIDAFRTIEFSVLTDRAFSYVSLVDLVFWFVGVFAAVFLARRPLSRADRLAIGMYNLKT